MELPASFIDYTRSLLGDEEYTELVTALESVEPVKAFWLSVRGERGSLVYFRLLS